jgi:hypothetical protein
MTDPKVLFIIGKGRSGSTVLDNALGQLDGFFSAGEVWRRWGRRPLDEYECGCGLSLRECGIWSRAIDLTLQELSSELGSSVSTAEILKWEQEVLRWHRVRRLLLQSSARSSGWPELEALAHTARALYHGIAEAANARVIVDSTKWPANLGALNLVPGIQPYIVHLIRDPRAVAFSWQRRKSSHAFGKPMPTFGATSSSASWMARNLVAEVARRRLKDHALKIRYEDFVEEPRATLESIVKLLGEEPQTLPLRGDRTLLLSTSHTVLGNPSRFVTGPVQVRNDDEWMARLGTLDRAIVTTLTLPLLWFYRYPLMSKRRAGEP